MFIEREIPVRGYEPDASRCIPAAVLLRYTEHLRWEALREDLAGFGSLFRGGRTMVVASQAVELSTGIGLGAPLRSEMWVGRVGRTSLEFRHRFWREARLCARARVTVVHLGPDGRPHPLPESSRDLATHADEAFTLCPPPPQGDPPAGARSWRLRVRPSELDFLQHINHANYMSLFDDARQLGALDGAPGHLAGPERLRQAAIDYLRPAVLGDELVVRSWPVEDQPGQLALTLHRASDERLLSRATLVQHTSTP